MTHGPVIQRVFHLERKDDSLPLSYNNEHMPRLKCRRNIEITLGVNYYKPMGVPIRLLDEVRIQLDEIESIRLADLEGLYQEDAAERMGISRQTFGRIIKEARMKIADALINGKIIRIENIDS